MLRPPVTEDVAFVRRYNRFVRCRSQDICALTMNVLSTVLYLSDLACQMPNLISKSVQQVILDAKVGPPSYENGLAKDIISIDDVLEIRDMMTKHRVLKIPDCSMIEANGVIQEFLASDKTHPSMDAIEDMLVEMAMKLKFRMLYTRYK
ncbi:pentatricopeptide repeat-containing protein [Cucumis melo var. makuwa]|uniref:Pentatricopeptide repeat-containing protein n=1 Tax=Cucumis melo var. makuwa TaxID=1194695 RepID=A0A5D3C2N9_CUCMM|nr:pentatricopeptide repeat-containing protein [Cucumis melo var. makuwa]TYK05564.1 pentatricopeptide repeat-containing protein [Cucumis melo var. makuwa]